MSFLCLFVLLLLLSCSSSSTGGGYVECWGSKVCSTGADEAEEGIGDLGVDAIVGGEKGRSTVKVGEGTACDGSWIGVTAGTGGGVVGRLTVVAACDNAVVDAAVA